MSGQRAAYVVVLLLLVGCSPVDVPRPSVLDQRSPGGTPAASRPSATGVLIANPKACAADLGFVVTAFEGLALRSFGRRDFAAFDIRFNKAYGAYQESDFDELDGDCQDVVGFPVASALVGYEAVRAAWKKCLAERTCDGQPPAITLAAWKQADADVVRARDILKATAP